MSAVPDLRPIRAFLDPDHASFATDIGTWADHELALDLEPAGDAAARVDAGVMLGAMGRAGWLRPIERGAWRSCCLAREALAAASPLADAVFALQALSTMPILHGGNAAMRELWLEPAMSGRAMGAFAMTEPDAGTDVAAMTARARLEADTWVLDGRKCFISNAGIAQFYAVFATTDPAQGGRGIGCFLVPADAPGFRFVRPMVMSSPHPLGEIAFESCRVPAANRLDSDGKGFALGLKTLDRLRPTVGAAACGMASRALQEAIAHAKTRKQFGKPIAEFQLVQEKLARMATELTAARLLVYRAAWEADQSPARITLEAAMAKSYATEAAQRVVDDAVQVLGGAGVLASSPVDRLYRSVRALRIYEGTTEIQHLVIAGQLLA